MRLYRRTAKPLHKIDPAVLLRDDSAFAYQEAYRTARTNLLYLPIEDRCKKIAVTSAMEAEGKSTVCANLAIAMAMAEKRVLLIDMDMRKPTQNAIFQKSRGPGLSEYLAGIDEKPTIQQTAYSGLSLLASGRIPKNPAELLLSKRLGTLFEQLEECYDYIFVDTPPVCVITDATLVANHVHGYILSVRAGYSNTDDMQKTAQTLREAGASVYGAVLNGMNPKGGRYGRYSKNGYYSSYGGAE